MHPLFGTRHILGVIVAALALSCASRGAEDSDLILHHGKVAVVDAAFSIAEAVAIKDGKILKIGSDADVLSTRGAKTEVIDLAGKLVIPGLIDSHTHAANACLTEFDHPIPDMESVADVLSYIKARAAVVPERQKLRRAKACTVAGCPSHGA